MSDKQNHTPSDHVAVYRFLRDGEVIEATDEFIGNDGQTWARPDGWEVGMEYPSNVFKSARRLISTKNAQDVISDRADWLVDAVATATQNRMFLRGEPECDEVACGAILINGEKAIRVAINKIIGSP